MTLASLDASMPTNAYLPNALVSGPGGTSAKPEKAYNEGTWYDFESVRSVRSFASAPLQRSNAPW